MWLVDHILLMPKDWHSKIAVRWMSPGGKRKQGQTWKSWHQTLKKDFKIINIS